MNVKSSRIFRLLAAPLLAATLSNHILAEEEKIPEVKTASGKTYKNVRITNVTPSEVKIFHEEGVARIPFADLPDELKTKLGYDPEKDKDHAASVVDQKKAALANAAKRELLERTCFRIVTASIVQVVDGGLYVRVDQTWDGKSYVIIPEYSYSGPGSSNGSGGGLSKHRNKDAGKRVKKITNLINDMRIFISCDNSKFVDGGKFSGNVWPNGRYSFTDTSGAEATIPKYTTNPEVLIGNK
jgi:hypothetical protein